MCAGAIAWAQTGKLVFRAADDKRGYQKYAPDALHPKTVVIKGVLADECAQLMKDFFKKKTMITGDRRRKLLFLKINIFSFVITEYLLFYCLLTCDVCLKLSRFQHSCHWHLAVC